MSARRLVVVALALGVTAFTLLPICDAIFDCGCTWPMWGADDHCDIRHAGPPDCPVCANWTVGALFTVMVFAAWTGVFGLGATLVPSRR